MTRSETTMILGVLKTSYPNFYRDMDKKEMLNIVNLWTEMFEDDDFDTVKVAVKSLIQTLKYPPTIADVKEEMYKINNPQNYDVMDLYSKLKKAIGNGIYGSVDEFNKLPPVVQKFVGSPNQLREWAIDEDFNDTVLRGQFTKQIEILHKREKEEYMMLPEVKEQINKILDKTNQVKYLN